MIITALKFLAGVIAFVVSIAVLMAWPAVATFIGFVFVLAMFGLLAVAALMAPFLELSGWERTPGRDCVERRRPQHFNGAGVVHAAGE